jgi:hypothetical protein
MTKFVVYKQVEGRNILVCTKKNEEKMKKKWFKEFGSTCAGCLFVDEYDREEVEDICLWVDLETRIYIS